MKVEAGLWESEEQFREWALHIRQVFWMIDVTETKVHYTRKERQPLNMKNDRTTHILARLEIGFRTNSAHLKELETDLAETLQSARHFGQQHGSPDDWNTNWRQQWDNVEGNLRRIKVLVNEMDGSIESNDSVRLKKALEAWETIQSEDAKLVKALSALQTQANELNAAAQEDWNLLARTLESHLETIQACAQALRIKLELLKKHSKEEVDNLVQDILSKLPNRAHAEGMDAGNYEQEYRKAAIELENEHHKFLGFVDVVKGLLMWVETTEERADKNLLVGADQAA
jgi:hypothetical protein